MKNTKLSLLALACLATMTLGACKGDRFADIKLITPASQATVEPRDVAFSWQTKKDGPVRFVLGSQDLSTIVLDTTLTGDALTYAPALHADSTYTWQVEQGDDINSSTFKVVDVASRFAGHYSGTAKVFSWLMGSGSSSTTHQAEIDLVKDGVTMEVSGDIEFSVPLYQFTDSSLVFAIPSLHNERYLTLDFVHDFIYISTYNGGLGGGTTYSFSSAR